MCSCVHDISLCSISFKELCIAGIIIPTVYPSVTLIIMHTIIFFARYYLVANVDIKYVIDTTYSGYSSITR